MDPSDSAGWRADLIAVNDAGASVAVKIRQAGPGLPWILYLPGFLSSMDGEKARAVDALARVEGWGCVRFDYRGHGASRELVDRFVVSDWIDDALAVLGRIDDAGSGVILVGSSMGVWIAAHVALRRPDRIRALAGIAGAPDFTLDLIEPGLDDEAWAALNGKGYVDRPSRYDDGTHHYTRALIEDGRRLSVLRAPLALDVPVRLIHGMADADVPWRQSLRLLEALSGRDVTLTLVKDGDHRLSRPADLDLIRGCVRGAVSACGAATR